MSTTTFLWKYTSCADIMLLLTVMIFLSSCNISSSSHTNLQSALPEIVDYNYHIKPILSDRCYACHGPDNKTREANLRLDTQEGALEMKLESGKPAIVAGSTLQSELWHRITSSDPQVMMPPPESHLTLSEYEVALLEKWIDQGAEWKDHWAFIPPQKSQIPKIHQTEWISNEIDAFVLAQLEQQNLSPSPRSTKERLIRRLSLDLRGLPPSLNEIDAFLEDDSPNAYEQLVDRFLADSAYGERMALEWLDVARYADSHGMHADGSRTMWPWRDWVIQAFNENMPYDQFMTYQLAGDMIPDATKEQILATAFHRNHKNNTEAGIIDEEYRLEYVYDRTNTTAKAFMGLTMECARCHDHKFDPISQKEYYQTAAFFNNVEELGMSANDGSHGPNLLVTHDSIDAVLSHIRRRLYLLEQKQSLNPQQITSQKAFLRTVDSAIITPSSFLLAHYPLDEISVDTDANGKKTQYIDRDKTTYISGEPEIAKGKTGNSLKFDNEFEFLHLNEIPELEITDAFSASAWIFTTKTGKHQTILGNSGAKNHFWRGWEMTLNADNQLRVSLIHALPDNYLRVESTHEVPLETWTQVAFTYDGSAHANGINLYINGQMVEKNVLYDRLFKSIKTIDNLFQRKKRPVRVAKSYRSNTGDDGIFQGKIDDLRIYHQALTPLEIASIHPDPARLDQLIAQKPDLMNEHLQTRKTDSLILYEINKLREKRLSLIDSLPEVMIMQEMESPRQMYVYERGDYTAPGESVNPATPVSVLPFPDSLQPDRLGLSKWLIDPAHPLTARVTVNRYWQMLFGKGLVSTPHDFGSQGKLPTHPLLLDHLAIWFIENGWDVKALLKYIVMSSTYQQTSAFREDLASIDPENELLARGPTFRLQAELIRDHALAVSGLLVRKIGGPSVRPYQPPGMWIEKTNFSQALLHYVQDSGANLYRRGMYTFIRRTVPPPSMIAFDATDRSDCIVQRQQTNTPMQALVLMNDPQFVEASRVMAERILKYGGNTSNSQLIYGFRLATGRLPANGELRILENLYHQEIKHFQHQPDSAAILLQVGEFSRDTTLDMIHHAAMTNVASMLLNHDEAYMKR